MSESTADVGCRDVYVSVDDQPAPHRLNAHNTLFRKHLDVTLTRDPAHD